MSFIEIPLVFYKLGVLVVHKRAHLDNHKVKYINVDPILGLVPPQCQSYAGNELVARKDWKFLLRQHWESTWTAVTIFWIDFGRERNLLQTSTTRELLTEGELQTRTAR